MSAQGTIARLESLLGRIKRKASEPRPVQAEVAHAAAEAELPLVVVDVVDVEIDVAEEAPPTMPQLTPQPAVAAAAPDPLAELDAEPMELSPPARDSEAPPLSAPGTEASLDAPAEIEELDMMDAEIVELGEARPPAHLARAADAEAPPALGNMMDEPIPESAPRPAAQMADVDREPPVKTPPPESGRQAVAGPTVSFTEEPEQFNLPEEAELPGSSSVDSLLEADLSGAPISKAPSDAPTMEQLGETVELEGADAPDATLELSLPPPPPSLRDEPDALELSLPKQGFSGSYDADLAPPSGSARDLARHRVDQEEKAQALTAAPIQISMPQSGPISVGAATVPVVSEPVVVARPPLESGVHPAEIVVTSRDPMPETFLELLDRALRL